MRALFIASLLVFGCSSSESSTGVPNADTGSSSDDTSTVVDTSTTTDSATEDSTTPDGATDDSATADSTPADSAKADSVAADTDKPDTAKTDAGKPDTDPGGSCSNPTDCRLFSSYCSTDPCKCIPLLKGEPSPKCAGTMVTCLVDPCNGKTADCAAGMCAAK